MDKLGTGVVADGSRSVMTDSPDGEGKTKSLALAVHAQTSIHGSRHTSSSQLRAVEKEAPPPPSSKCASPIRPFDGDLQTA